VDDEQDAMVPHSRGNRRDWRYRTREGWERWREQTTCRSESTCASGWGFQRTESEAITAALHDVSCQVL